MVHSELAEINLTRRRRNTAVEPAVETKRLPLAKSPPVVKSHANSPAESKVLAAAREPTR